jgi:hypothetical protein
MRQRKKQDPIRTTEETSGMDFVYFTMSDAVDKMGRPRKKGSRRKLSVKNSKALFHIAMRAVLEVLYKEGSVRLGDGFGTLKIVILPPSLYKLPSGHIIEKGSRKKVKFSEGIVVKAAMKEDISFEEIYEKRERKSNYRGRYKDFIQ